MSVPSVPKRPSRDEFSGDYAEDLDGLLSVIGDAQEALITAAADVVTPYFRADLYMHATEKRIRTPLPPGMKCTSIAAVKCIGVTLGTDGRPTTATYALDVASVRWRSLSRTQDDGEVVGVTIQYAPPLGLIIGQRAADQSIAHNTNVPIAYDTILSQAGTALALNTTTGLFTAATNGVVELSTDILWDAAGGGERDLWAEAPSGSGIRWGSDARDPVAGAANIAISQIKTSFPVTANSTFRVLGFQNKTVVTALLIRTMGVNYRNSVSARYVSCAPAAAGSVRLMFFGE